MSRVNHIQLQNYEWFDEAEMSFEVIPEDWLCDLIDEIREKDGNTDLQSNPNNDVWYNFYLEVDFDNYNIRLYAICNNGEKDDYAQYEVELDTIEEKILLYKAFYQYAEEKDGEYNDPRF